MMKMEYIKVEKQKKPRAYDCPYNGSLQMHRQKVLYLRLEPDRFEAPV